jgi:thiol-disulfide isomerase/thioredoxin
MNKILLFLIVPVLLCCKKAREEVGSVIEVPIEIEDGFGPFSANFSIFNAEYTADNPDGAGWIPTYRPVRGVPKWEGLVKSMIWLDGYQLVYQNFHEGKIGKEMYEQLQKSWDWVPDETVLSKKPLKCFVYTVRGRDETGKIAVMVDTNNNLDFSDETAFYPERIYLKEGKYDWDSAGVYKKVFMVQREHVLRGEVVKDSIPMIIKYAPDDEEWKRFWYAFPRYGKARFDWKGKEHEIVVNNFFTNAGFDESNIFVEKDLDSKKRLAVMDGVEKGELIEVGGLLDKSKFRNLGVDPRTGSLLLQAESADLDEYSLQKGYAMRPFKAKEFKTGKDIALADFRGKYVFIDFWGTWCGPCVQQLPGLREIYKGTNKNQVQFIGIVKDTEERLDKYLIKNNLEWPQILSDSVNKLIETYNITDYPTTILLGPDGRVIDRNIHGEALKTRLKAISAGPVL